MEMGSRKSTRVAVLTAALVAMLGVGMLTVSANVAGIGDSGWMAFAQNGNGNGNGNNGNGNPGNSGDAPGNSGNAPGQQDGAPGNSENAPGQSDGAPGNSENAPGQQNAEPVTPAEDEATGDEAGSGADKVNVCHVTDQESGDSHMISISTNAVPAHEGHGDTQIDVASEEECQTAEAPNEEDAAATPAPEDGDEDGDDDADLATPVPATPVATPIG
jgi:hypothetical protein